LIDNRRLAVASVLIAAAALLAMSFAQTAGVFLAATLVVGIACTSVQILLPFAAHFTTDADRGRVIGSLTSGLMLGIMLARPAASFVTYYAGWRAVFAVSAALMGITAAILATGMPRYQPDTRLSYFGILRSLPGLLRDVPILRRRAAYHAALYASFSLFWTAVPLLLASERFGLTQHHRGSRLDQTRDRVRDCGGAGSVCDRADRRRNALDFAPRDRGNPHRRRPCHQFRVEPTLDLWTAAGEPQPHRRAVHRDLLRRWCAWFGARGREPRSGRLGAHHPDRNGVRGRGARALRGRTFSGRAANSVAV
jgi:hypothetical protein